jgi:DNA gyrase subunit A
MRLRPKDEVIAMALAGGGQDLVTLTEIGYGKRTPVKDYPKKGRGGLGVVTHKLTDKTGRLAGAFVGSKDQDVFVISTTGIVIRVSAGDIRQTGRPSQGVRVMRLAGRTKVAAVAPVAPVVNQDAEEG